MFRVIDKLKEGGNLGNATFNSVKNDVSIWTEKNLWRYTDWVEAGRNYEVKFNWLLMNPSRRVIYLGDGDWTALVERRNVDEAVSSLLDLYKFVKNNNGDFLFIAAPFKVDKYGDFAVNAKLDFSNKNADDFLAQLHKAGVETLDLRENLHAWSQEDGSNYHNFFYKTDHHWKPETALKAAKVVGERIKGYGIPVDDRHYNLNSFYVETLPKFFLGSLGKKVSLAKAEPDDFSVLHPNFESKIHFMIPQREIDVTGPLDKVAYDYHRISMKDFYNQSPYIFYGYGDMQIINMENLLLPETNKNILLIKDSFSDAMGPMLVTGVRNLTMLDLRVFNGSLRTYIKEHKPNLVVIMYNPSAIPSKIKWNHADLFDFR